MNNNEAVREVLLRFISTNFSGASHGIVHAETDLLGTGIIDSLGMMSLVFFLEQEFNVEIPPEDVIIDHFGSVCSIERYLTARMP